MPAVAWLLVGPPLPERSKMMTQTKRDTPVLRDGVRRAAGDRTLEKFTLLRRLKIIIPADAKKDDQSAKSIMKVRNWREKCKDRRLWNKIVKQARTHQGL